MHRLCLATQAQWRGRAARKHLAVLRAAILLQSTWRGVLARQTLASRRTAAIVVQTAWRCHRQHSRFQRLQTAVVQVHLGLVSRKGISDQHCRKSRWHTINVGGIHACFEAVTLPHNAIRGAQTGLLDMAQQPRTQLLSDGGCPCLPHPAVGPCRPASVYHPLRMLGVNRPSPYLLSPKSNSTSLRIMLMELCWSPADPVTCPHSPRTSRFPCCTAQRVRGAARMEGLCSAAESPSPRSCNRHPGCRSWLGCASTAGSAYSRRCHHPGVR